MNIATFTKKLNKFPSEMRIVTLHDNDIVPYDLAFYPAILRRKVGKAQVLSLPDSNGRDKAIEVYGYEPLEGEEYVFDPLFKWEVENIYPNPSDVRHMRVKSQLMSDHGEQYERIAVLVLVPRIREYTPQGDHKMLRMIDALNERKKLAEGKELQDGQ